MKIHKRNIAALIVLVLSSVQLFASSLSLSGTWLDAKDNKMSILQSDTKLIVSRQSIKMNGSVNGTAIKMTVNNTTLTGILSADNMIITWSNGSEWYREIRGSWKNKDGENKNVEQAGNIIRIKNTKGEVEFLGFIKSNGLTLINKSNSNSVSGTLSSIQQITWSDGSVWTK